MYSRQFWRLTLSRKPNLIDQPVAFFDLDLTILKVNSATLWVKSEYRQGMISTLQLIKAAWFLTRYHLGSTSLDSALQEAIMSLKGQRELDLIKRVHHFYRKEISNQVRAGAYHTLDKHRDQGHLCYLMTSASSYLSELIVQDLKLDGALAQHFEVHKGILTGHPRGGLCFGAGKLTQAETLLIHSPITLSDCFFYTDSFSDLPLLEAVGYPQIVHPDRKLQHHALKQSWHVNTW